MGLGKLDSVAVLEALAPDEGWETDVALVSTYSLDLVAAAALVTALAGEGEDHENINKAALARACERLRDRFRVICQAGRVSVPKAGQKALVLADRWVRAVQHDGNERSWHAKLALVRYSRGPEVSWRMWLGSRNLTRDTSWDSAVIAIGRPNSSTGPESPSIARGGAVLAEKADLPHWSRRRVLDELTGIRWAWPKDVVAVESFVLWPDGDAAPGFPKAPPETTEVVAICPFVDAATCARVTTWGGPAAHRTVLSVPTTLANLAATKSAAIAKFNEVYSMEPPPALDAPEPERPGVDQVAEEHRGLHAKLLWCRAADGDHLWLGSANLTARAWGGANTEVVARLRVAPAVGNALLKEVVKGCTLLVPADLAGAAVAEDARQKKADSLRNTIAASWDGQLKRQADGSFILTTSSPPLPRGTPATLSCRLVGAPDLAPWPEGERSITLPSVRLHEETELVELHLRLHGEPEVKASWVQRAPLDPSPSLERDRAVLSRLMGPRAFLLWLRQMVDDVVGESEGERWPESDAGTKTKSRAHHGIRELFPTLESVLRAWTRDPSAVVRLDRAILTWASHVRIHLPDDDDGAEAGALKELDVFLTHWTTLRDGLALDAGGPTT